MSENTKKNLQEAGLKSTLPRFKDYGNTTIWQASQR